MKGIFSSTIQVTFFESCSWVRPYAQPKRPPNTTIFCLFFQVLLKMKSSGLSRSCLRLAISVFSASFFIIVDSNINRGPTKASARFQAFEGNLIVIVFGFS